MFVSTLSIMDGFKLTLPNGEEISINLIRTAGMNVATISIDCEDNVLIEKTESTLPQLEKVKQELLDEINKLTSEYTPLLKNKKETKISNKKRKFTKQPKCNQNKPFQSGKF